jgi:putative transposase
MERAPTTAPDFRWPHSPPHQLSEAGAYMATSGTYQKQPYFHGADRLNFLTKTLLNLALHYGLALQARAVFPNHYHFIAEAKNSQNLAKLIKHVHTATAAEVNRRDALVGRKVWFQFWDSRITFQRSLYARLNYVHQNPVHHCLVRQASLYPWCSAAWFEREANRAFFKTVSSFRHDTLKIPDDFKVDSTC